MRYRYFLFAAGLVAFSAPALAGPTEDFQKLEDEYWAATLRNSPVTASSVGVQIYDRQLDEIGIAVMDRQAAEAGAFLKRLDAISAAPLSTADQANQAILKRQLEGQVEGNRFGQRMLLYSILGSYHNNIAGLGEGLPFRTRADYDNYLARLELVPARMRAYSDLSVAAARQGYTQPCVTMTKFGDTISGSIAADPAKSRFYAPFAAHRPTNISEAEWSTLQTRAKTVISGKIDPSYKAFGVAYNRDIKAKCRADVSASTLPQGREYYAFQVRQQTTTDLSPDAIHQLGLTEVARIRAEMVAVAKKAGFASREAMIADMRTNSKYYAKTPEELMAAASRMAKIIDGQMPALFGRLPRLPYGLKEIPPEIAPGSTTAYYQPGSPDAGLAGNYYVNTTKLDQRPLWELPALTVHEAVPGHHNQIALQQELELPAWRKYTAFFTAFVEGWGLYSERLGIEMGLYDTPQKDMGRLSYEMWRACRLVVDTGLHSKGWSKERAVAFMKDNSALTDANIDAEVNRYISNPGQALAYKLGELKIRELRARSEKALGDKFDLRRFHDAVLGQGAVPLDTLEAQINAWIASEKSRS
ncbi:MAG: DUF885 domain-containing protein [Sphingomonas sp.]|uniref:DUF885 domain-containing protein n=1 Tax=Sphingomonas sp. TaxID=28214 RepID=UPI0017E7697E|nr:DUF885 domain-containing protein [Sphingomonas sp.]MBA3668293.1 DUF885 domain-containing protein [Sphingomonas sp.]